VAIGTAFVAYPSNVREVREAILATVSRVGNLQRGLQLRPWEANDVPGKCLVDPILEEISNATFVVADISRLNFNVVYEVGFSIGKQKRVILLRNRAIKRDERLARETGIFDTIGYQNYANSEELAKYLIDLKNLTPLPAKANALKKPSTYLYRFASREGRSGDSAYL
jgi:hypothetical protein